MKITLSTSWKVSVFGVFLVRILPQSDWIRRNTLFLSVLIPNEGKYGPVKLRIRTLFTHFISIYSELNYCPWVFLLCKFGDHSSCWHHCTRKTKFSIKVFFIKCDQIRIFLWIWSHLLKKFLMENFIFCAVHGILVSCRCHAILQWWHLTLTGAS